MSRWKLKGLDFATDVCGLFCLQIFLDLGVKEFGENMTPILRCAPHVRVCV